MYTTNAVESINSSFRKVTKKGAFPNENALLKLLYLRTTELYKKWNGSKVQNWAMIRNQLATNEKISASILSSNIIDKWLKIMSQFRHLCVQRSTIFCDAKYNILRRMSSFVNDDLFFVICLNWRFSPSIIFVVYIIFRTSGGYAKNVDRISQFPSQLFTQEG